LIVYREGDFSCQNQILPKSDPVEISFLASGSVDGIPASIPDQAI
jgi:hypothetical protein